MNVDESPDLHRIADNLAVVRRRIDDTAIHCGRSAESVTLVAVTKTLSIAHIEAAYAAGQRDFGENRLEELWQKIDAARTLGLDDIRWHMIGTIQSRKTSQAIGPIVLIHSVDRLKIARRLSRDAVAASCVLSVLLEVNISGEASKHGFTADDLQIMLPELDALPGIKLEGLMTMAPYIADMSAVRPVFAGLRRVRDELVVRNPGIVLPELSMGMTNDFPVAIEEGATLVRIGSAIFGARHHGA